MTRGKWIEGRRRISVIRSVMICHNAIKIKHKYLEEVQSHVPLATIADVVAGEVNNKPVIQGKVDVLNREFKIVVCFVEFVIEGKV